MAIRYGRVSEGSREVEWLFVSHCECDGIGGFARLLRERGAEIGELPKTKHPCSGLIGPLWRMWRGRNSDSNSADRRDWRPYDQTKGRPSISVAWHLFTENETTEIRERCRRERITVNSLLLKHLDQAVRPDIQRPELAIPWMIPVNLRGDIEHNDDTGNHVSYVEPRIGCDDSPAEIQKQIRDRLERGEHRANYLLLGMGRFLNHERKVALIRKDRAMPEGNIGAFSNLGVWDPEKTIASKDFWLFCPPVVDGQLLGAGAVSFQNRFSLTIQGHPDLPNQVGMTKNWMGRLLLSIRRPFRPPRPPISDRAIFNETETRCMVASSSPPRYKTL